MITCGKINEIMILINEKNRGDKRQIGERRVENLELQKCHYDPYTFTIDKGMMIELIDIMWPTSQSLFYILFILIEMKFHYYYFCVMFTMKSMSICNN